MFQTKSEKKFKQQTKSIVNNTFITTKKKRRRSRKSRNKRNNNNKTENSNTNIHGTLSNAELSKIRIRQKNVCYVVGLQMNICNEELLHSSDYFGQFGEITEIRIINGPDQIRTDSGCVHINFKNNNSAKKAVKFMNKYIFEDGRRVKANFGITEYCTNFIQQRVCNNYHCYRKHEWCTMDEVITKKEIEEFNNKASGAYTAINYNWNDDNDNMKNEKVTVVTMQQISNTNQSKNQLIINHNNKTNDPYKNPWQLKIDDNDGEDKLIHDESSYEMDIESKTNPSTHTPSPPITSNVSSENIESKQNKNEPDIECEVNEENNEISAVLDPDAPCYNFGIQSVAPISQMISIMDATPALSQQNAMLQMQNNDIVRAQNMLAQQTTQIQIQQMEINSLRQQLETMRNKSNNVYNSLQSNKRSFDGLMKQYNDLQTEHEELQLKYSELDVKYIKLKKQIRCNYTAWEWSDVYEWIISLNNGYFKKYSKDIYKNVSIENIDGSCLSDLNSTDLHRIGITDFKDKKLLIENINKLISINNTNNNQYPIMRDGDNEGNHTCQ